MFKFALFTYKANNQFGVAINSEPCCQSPPHWATTSTDARSRSSMIGDRGRHDWLAYGYSLLLDLLWWQHEVAPPSPLAPAAEGHPLDGSSSPLHQAVVGTCNGCSYCIIWLSGTRSHWLDGGSPVSDSLMTKVINLVCHLLFDILDAGGIW